MFHAGVSGFIPYFSEALQVIAALATMIPIIPCFRHIDMAYFE
jgi:hypothetical protein